MPRAARKKSSTGIYHVMLRGINRQLIFADEEDYGKYMQTLADVKVNSGYSLYSYCLMGNHIHLLIEEGKEKLEQIFKRIGSRYVYWYNWKYNRSGHLFQDRYKSEPVENDAYLLSVLRYIHQNPKKAGICSSIETYKWSSHKEYINKTGIVDYGYVLSIIGEENYTSLMNEESDENYLEERSKRLRDEELIREIEKKFGIKAMFIQNEPRAEMERILRAILKIDGVSTRQLSRVTQVSVNIIWGL
jgi:REP element-mobilizing transposase RayT